MITLGVMFLAIRILEKISVFFPSKEILQTPASVRLDFEDVFITDGQAAIRIHGWWIPRMGADKTVLFLHGNAGNIGDRLDKAQLFHELGVNVLMIDYRGFGRSEGKPTEAGMYRDSQLALNFLYDDKGIPSQDVVVYGDSLGGVAATYVAAHNEVGGLVVDSSFTHSRDMARYMYPWVPSFLVRKMLDSLERIVQVDEPKLFFHSPEDRTVPFALGRKLFDAAAQPKTFIETRGGHNDAHLHSDDLYRDALSRFLEDLHVRQ